MKTNNNFLIPFELHDYQRKAAEELTKNYPEYQQKYRQVKNPIPFLKLLSSVTGSGKTAILAQTVNNFLTYYPQIKPIIF
jgi:primosomal protein N'